MLATAPRYLFFALYAAAALVLLDQAAELIAGLVPNFNLSSPEFRFAAFGLIISRTTTAVIVDALVILAALGLHHARLLRIWGILHVVVAALLLVGLAFFLLDTVELRNAVNRDAASTFVVAAVRASVMVVLAVGYCGWILVASGRAGRRSPSVDKDDDEGPVLVTGA